VLAVRPHIGRIRSGVSFPDATITRTFPFAAAYLQRIVWLHPLLETHDDVIGVAHNDDLTSGLALSPSVCPEVEDSMEIDIDQQWRGNRPLGRAWLCGHKLSVFHHACLQPLADKTICASLHMWEWGVRVLDIREGVECDHAPVLLGGRGAAPPEFCGGGRGKDKDRLKRVQTMYVDRLQLTTIFFPLDSAAF